MPALSDDQVTERLSSLPGWGREGDEIVKVFELVSFPGAIDFVTRVAELAEEADHHPDIDIRYRRVRVALTTHDEGGISDLDFRLAGAIDAQATADPSEQ